MSNVDALASFLTKYDNLVSEIDKRDIKEATVYQKIGVSRQTWQHYKTSGKIPFEKAYLIADWLENLYQKIPPVLPEFEEDMIDIKTVSVSASAGVGMDIDSIHSIDYDYMKINKSLMYGIKDYTNIRAICVDGKSMLPNIMPSDWAIYEERIGQYLGDGLYIVNFGGMLMIKRIQYNPEIGRFDIISDNPAFKSYSVVLSEDDQTTFMIIGRVITTIQR